MRREYLFDLANLCHMDARQVDALRLFDFFQYILGIDDYWKRERERWEAMNNQG